MVTSNSGHFANIFCLVFAQRVASTRRVDGLLSGHFVNKGLEKAFLPPLLLDVHSPQSKPGSAQFESDTWLEETSPLMFRGDSN